MAKISLKDPDIQRNWGVANPVILPNIMVSNLKSAVYRVVSKLDSDLWQDNQIIIFHRGGIFEYPSGMICFRRLDLVARGNEEVMIQGPLDIDVAKVERIKDTINHLYFKK